MWSNTKAKFSNKTKELIYERDNWCCIICWTNSNLQFHHAFYSIQAMYWKNRNDVSQGVTICFSDHLKAHSCSSGEWIREECILYLKQYYEKNK